MQMAETMLIIQMDDALHPEVYEKCGQCRNEISGADGLRKREIRHPADSTVS
jgi:hypothetical protein